MELTLSISIIVITCLISIPAFNNGKMVDDLSMWPYMVKERNQYYRFITSGFVHGDFMHLGFNMLTLYFFGSGIENAFALLFGSKLYFLFFYVLALILSDMPTFIKHRNHSYYRTIGASGAVSAVVFAAILFAPWNNIYVYFIRVPAIVYGVLYLGYTIYMSRGENRDGINHDAHLWGAVVGILFPIVYKPELASYFLEALLAGPGRR